MSTRSPSVHLKIPHGATRPRWALVALPLLLASGGFVGCKERPTSPEASLRSFLGHVYMRKAAPAYAALSKSSQEALKKDAEALALAAGEPSAKAKPEALLFEQADLTLLAKPGSISVVSPLGGEEVLLRVTVEAGRSANIRMVREGREWKVDLLGSLEPMKFEPPEQTKTSTRTGIEGTELDPE